MTINTKINIMDTALKLFAEKGFSDTSISAIAEEAGIGKGTIYWYFESKKDLFFSIVEQRGQDYFNKVLKLDNDSIESEQIIYKYIKYTIEFIDNNYDVAKMLITNTEIINNEFKKMMELKQQEVISILEKALKRGQKEDKFRGFKSRDIAFMIMNIAKSGHNQFNFSIEGNIDQKTQKIYDFIMYGLIKEERKT